MDSLGDSSWVLGGWCGESHSGSTVWTVASWCTDVCIICYACFFGAGFFFWHLVSSPQPMFWDRAHPECMPFRVRTSLIWAGGTRAYGVLFPIVFGSVLAAELCESRGRSRGTACWCGHSANTWGRWAFNARPVPCCYGSASLLGNMAFFLLNLTWFVLKKGMLGHILCL